MLFPCLRTASHTHGRVAIGAGESRGMWSACRLADIPTDHLSCGAMNNSPEKEALDIEKYNPAEDDLRDEGPEPVDTAAFPAYLSVVKFPMDLGTMTRNFEAGKYKSLEQFSVCRQFLGTTNCRLTRLRRPTFA